MRLPCLPSLLAAFLALPLPVVADEACSRYADDLAVMKSADQALRKRIDYLDPESRAQQKLMQHIQLVERVNTERLKDQVRRCGWPSKAMHGEAAVGDAWLLVQQAEREPAFQKRMLALIEQAASESGDTLDRAFAYLDDRIAVAEKRLQRYGTQLVSAGEDRCALAFAPFDSREQVEARRAQLNLPPLDIYRRMVLEMQHCPVPPTRADDHHYAPPARGKDRQGAITRK
ncbi:DUF6624 domain-containing protein [Massilia sp. BSC265]|uniref:DUF6624 domain-containing protein n=1 Tax=Massilia sp. BSC265 TaxID=1549812 RepID=UPI00068F0DFB|nr:DUF6624 domain-containing protein [Massilia sp. BSC265]